MQRPPLPPFNYETALAKVKAAEDAWNTRDPQKVAQAYTPDSTWRTRDKFFEGREAIEDFLAEKWSLELHYRLMKELWAYTDNRISVRFEYEWQHAKLLMNDVSSGRLRCCGKRALFECEIGFQFVTLVDNRYSVVISFGINLIQGNPQIPFSKLVYAKCVNHFV